MIDGKGCKGLSHKELKIFMTRAMSKVFFNSRRKEYLWSILFHGPGFVFFTIFFLAPILFSIFISFFKWRVISPMRFAGLANYIKIFSDPKIGQVSTNTIIFVLEVLIFSVVISLLIAILLSKIKISKSFFQSIYFLPLISSGVSVALMWRWIYSEEYGILNVLLKFFIKENIAWLNDSRFALTSIAIILIWKIIPLNVILFTAAVKNVPASLYEAAKIDGCREIGLFWYVTLPMISPTLFFVIILTLINSFFAGFDLVKVLTQGGPLNSTNTYAYYLYEVAFNNFQFGYASSIAFMFFAVILIITYVQFVLQKKWVHY